MADPEPARPRRSAREVYLAAVLRTEADRQLRRPSPPGVLALVEKGRARFGPV